MNRTDMNKEANKRMKRWCIDNGITRCELCGTDQWLSFAHRMKRRYYLSVDDLSNHKEFLLLCVPCHTSIEFNSQETERLFRELR